MLPRNLHLNFKLLLVLTLVAVPSLGQEQHYDSGLLSRFSLSSSPASRVDEATALSRFVDDNFASRRPAFEWREVRVDRDATHAHALYQLQYEGRKVAQAFLKVHYRHEGWVDYASSSWRFPFNVNLPSPSLGRRGELESDIRRELQKEKDLGDLTLKLEPVIWTSQSGRAVAAMDVVATAASRGFVRHFYVDEENGSKLADVPAARSLDVSTQKIYKKSPLSGAPTLATLTGLDSLTTLASSHIHVYRHEKEATPRVVEVNPGGTAYSDDGAYTTAPSTFDEGCGGSTTSGDTSECPNQAFDAVNVFYHVQTFRERVDTLFTTMGNSTSVFQHDPLPALVNAFVDTDGRFGNDRNNALYIPSGCPSGTGGGACIVFVPPMAGALPACGSGTKTFYDPAREAVVLIHEYQHYVTDMISGMIGASDLNFPAVADILHEGYSDYFGASQVTKVVGSDVTLVGDYFLQDCVPLKREIGVLKPFENTSEDLDPHYAGISWASALWTLRASLGADKVDLLALKSLFFMPVQPTSFDAVEAVVKADEALNAGVNVRSIRHLFYSETLFLAGAVPPFDPLTKFVEVGFSGCNSVPRPASAGMTWLGALLWLFSTVLMGRRKRSQS